MKKSMIFIILALMLISLVGVVAATSYPQYVTNIYRGQQEPNSYLTRSIDKQNSPNPVNYENFKSCYVGYGTEKGVYPISLTYQSEKYNFLVVPTDDAIRVINSNCSEINVVSVPNVEFYGILGNLVNNPTGEQDYADYSFVLTGYNSLTDETGFYIFRFDFGSKQIEYFNNYNTNLTGVFSDYYFGGTSCGITTRTDLSSDAYCSFIYNDILYVLDMQTFNISEYLAPQTIIKPKQTYTVDFDNDNINEIFIGNTYTNAVRFMTFDLQSKTFDHSLIDTVYQYYGNINPAYNDETTYPCQIGGVLSEMEVCVYANRYRQNAAPYNFPATYIIDKNGVLISESYSTSSLLGYDIIKGSVFDYNKDGNNDFTTPFSVKDYNGNTLVSFSDLSIPENSMFTMDITGDNLEEFIFSNGKVINNDGTPLNYTFDYLDSNKKGYLIGGDLNGDYEDEIIYADVNNIYIYSTNPTNDYITELNITPPYVPPNECVYNSSSSFEECEDLREEFENEKNLCTLEDVNLCYNYVNENPILNFSCNFYNQQTISGCITLNNEYINGLNNCTNYLIEQCFSSFEEQDADELVTLETGLPFLLGKIQLNVKILFGLIIIGGVVFGAAKNGIKNPLVLILVGVIATILASVLGLIPSSVLIIMIVVMALILLLGMTVFKPKED